MSGYTQLIRGSFQISVLAHPIGFVPRRPQSRDLKGRRRGSNRQFHSTFFPLDLTLHAREVSSYSGGHAPWGRRSLHHERHSIS